MITIARLFRWNHNLHSMSRDVAKASGFSDPNKLMQAGFRTFIIGATWPIGFALAVQALPPADRDRVDEALRWMFYSKWKVPVDFDPAGDITPEQAALVIKLLLDAHAVSKRQN